MIDNIESIINDAASISASPHYTAESSFMIDGQRETMICILAEAKLSSVISQTTAALKKQSKNGLHRLVSTLMRGTLTYQGIFRNRIKSC